MSGRQTQHKPPREVVRGRELSDLKKENKVLRKQLSRSRKEQNRLLASTGVEGSPEGVLEESPEISRKPTCPKCGSIEFASVELPTGTLEVCKACLYRHLKRRA